MKQGLLGSAREMAQSLLQRGRRLDILQLMLAIEEQAQQSASALEYARECLRFTPGNVDLLIHEIRLMYRLGQYQELIVTCDNALALQPDNVTFTVMKSAAMDMCHNYAEALDILQPFLKSKQPMPEVIDVATRALFGLKRYDEALQLARPCAADPRTPPQQRRTIGLQIFKILDRLGQFDAAMEACHQAQRNASGAFDKAGFSGRVEDAMATFQAKSLRMFARSGIRSELPVFVVGMPRSGTTLVEQIIAAHPMAFGGGELSELDSIAHSITTETQSMHTYPSCLADVSPAVADRLALRHLSMLKRLGGDAERVTDKMLDAWQHIGLIWMLFPGARIIHIQRDPLDVCLSCYTRPLNMPYVSNLEHLGFVARQFERLMGHWKATLDIPALTIRYEDLVADQQNTTRRIIDFVGLPWNDSCLRYYESRRKVTTLSFDQVNKPIYDSSIGRWRHYDQHLGPLKAALGLAS